MVIATFILLEVVMPRVAEVVYEEFLKAAAQVIIMAKDIDEEKLKRMAQELTAVIMNTVLSSIGGKMKESVVEWMKFWKWGRKKT